MSYQKSHSAFTLYLQILCLCNAGIKALCSVPWSNNSLQHQNYLQEMVIEDYCLWDKTVNLVPGQRVGESSSD